MKAAAATGADRVELYTKPYADLYPTDPEAAIAPFFEAATAARKAGLGVNAGHDLSLVNLEFFSSRIPLSERGVDRSCTNLRCPLSWSRRDGETLQKMP